MKNSTLTNLLSGLAAVTNVPTATLVLIKDAAVKLGGVVGRVLKENRDDYVYSSELSLTYHE